MSLRTLIRPVVDLADRRFAEGTEESRRQARQEAAEQIRVYQQHEAAMRSQLPEVPRGQIEFGKFGRVEIAGEFYAVIRGHVDDPSRSPAVAWYVDEHGEIVWLERPPSGPRSRAELEQREAERAQREATPKPKPAWMT